MSEGLGPQEGAVQLLDDNAGEQQQQPVKIREPPDRGPYYSHAQATFRFGGTGLSDGLFDCGLCECCCCMVNPGASCSYGPFRLRTDLKRMSFSSWAISTLIAIVWMLLMIGYSVVLLPHLLKPPVRFVGRVQEQGWRIQFQACLEKNSCTAQWDDNYEHVLKEPELWPWDLEYPYRRDCEFVHNLTSGCKCEDEEAKRFVQWVSDQDCDTVLQEAMFWPAFIVAWIIFRDIVMVAALLALFTLVRARYRLRHGMIGACIKAYFCTSLFFLQLSRHVDCASGYLKMPAGHEGREVLVGDPVEVNQTEQPPPQDSVYNV